MSDRSFEAFREQMSISFPSLDDLLAGGEGGLDAWWEAVKDQISEQLPAARGILDQLDFVGLYQSNTATPSRDEIPFIPFRFHILAAATTMTRDEFVAFQSNRSEEHKYELQSLMRILYAGFCLKKTK